MKAVTQAIVVLFFASAPSSGSLSSPLSPHNTIFELPGVFFTPSPTEEIKTWNFPVANERIFSGITVELDVTPKAWWSANPDGVHNLFWLTRRGTWRSDTVGYVNLFGPERSLLKQMTNLELGKGEAQNQTTNFQAQLGQTYQVKYCYDADANTISTVLSKKGNPVATVTMDATAGEIQTKEGFYQLWIGLNEKYNECPTHGWTYANLRIVMEPATITPRSPAHGPLFVHPTNPRYFDDGSGRAVLLAGVNHGWELQDRAWDTDFSLDWPDFLTYLEGYKLNMIRLWRVESTTGKENPSFLTSPMPYQRTGAGKAHDGQPKFDLHRFNPVYFQRMRERCISAGQKGIYVVIMFFEKHSSFNQRKPGSQNFPWHSHPFHPDNNINGVNADLDGDGCPREMHHLPQPDAPPQRQEQAQAILELQKAYIRKVIDTVNDLDNVLLEIANEALPDTATDNWQRHLLDYAKAYEADKPKQHPIGFTGPGMEKREDPWPDFSDQFKSNADFVSPRDGDIYEKNPPAATGAKIIFADSDHIAPYRRDAIWVWKCFTRGLHPQALEGYTAMPADPPRIDPVRDERVRRNLGFCLDYAQRMNLATMTPRNDLSSTTYCLAAPGQEYLVFAPQGGSFTIKLGTDAPPLRVEWLSIQTGTRLLGETLDKQGVVSLTSPLAGPVAVYLKEVDSSETQTP